MERKLIKNADIFDGQHSKLIENAKIVIENNLIADILQGDIDESGFSEIIDAGRLTAIPGLTDAHTNRKVGGKWFDIIVDDEGMLKENPIVSALDSDMQPALVGNLLFCNWDGETGEEISLSDDDIKHLEKYTALAVQKDAEGRELDCLLVMTKVDFE